jgi:hypothetical protein
MRIGLAFDDHVSAFACDHVHPGLTPDFLYVALDASAYAAFFTESRTRLIDPTELHRKSGSVLGHSQPSLRDWSFALI